MRSAYCSNIFIYKLMKSKNSPILLHKLFHSSKFRFCRWPKEPFPLSFSTLFQFAFSFKMNRAQSFMRISNFIQYAAFWNLSNKIM